MILNLTDQNFEEEIKKAEKPILVDFYADWCQPCGMLAPVLEKVAEDLGDKIILGKANLDDVPLTAQKFGVEQIPTVALFSEGKPLGGFVGFRPEEEIKKWLTSMNI